MPDTPENVHAFFLSRVRDHLHVLFCTSPAGSRWSDRVRQFPAIFAAASIDWFMPWPEDALRAVAASAVAGLDMACADEARVTGG